MMWCAPAVGSYPKTTGKNLIVWEADNCYPLEHPPVRSPATSGTGLKNTGTFNQITMPNILKETEGRLLTLTINRPDKLNTLYQSTLGEVPELFTEAASDPDVGGIILTGEGKKAFVAGADLPEFAGFGP